VADVGEEKSLGDDNVGGVLVGGGVARAFVGVPLSTNMGIAAPLLVVFFLLLSSPLLVVAPVTRYRTFCNKMTGLTTFVTHFLGAGFVVLPPPLFENLAEALDDAPFPHCRAWRCRLVVYLM
jgi:heme/copper-type cytochrome/quinol oxidase subunit 3